jgi:ligand-binding sensor domain-containing protein
MKNTLILATVLISFVSCEKSDFFSSEKVNTNFKTKIAEGYFVTAIAFDKLGNTWIGTFDKGLLKYNASGVTVYNAENSNLSDPSVIYSVATDSKNNVWLGTNAGGLIKFDGNRFIHYNASNSPLPDNFVYTVAIDSKDNVWLTAGKEGKGHQGGFIKFDGKRWEIYTKDNTDYPLNVVQSITIDNNDNVWMAVKNGLKNSYLIKFTDDIPTVYDASYLGFSPYAVGRIKTDSKNRLYSPIDYSLSSAIINEGPQAFIFDGTKTETLQFDDRTRIMGLTVDRNENVWLATGKGIAVYNGKKWIVDDTKFNGSGMFAIEHAPDGTIWIGTTNGVYINK